ncbi:MAG TPA: alpha-amylase/4-alpha-glucanotransferase domain-containing protein [Candidatus Limnocylindrales bacterium]|nr:alpha-amylase/4-alpha-glucanotransferase domain-containing protein [Candidatus Limnocylindrales bacterium]
MAPRISLALTLHNHQPVGNFGWVFAEVYEKAYEPMVAALERHPRVRVGLHYSGPLLEWLEAERSEFLPRIRTLVARDQVEILGGGLYEPILAALPDRDRVDQLVAMSRRVAGLFGARPRGAWLAERVWEPDVPTATARGEYDWTILDDEHFRRAGVPDAELWGPYITDDQGNALTVFGTEQGLRYRIPFREVEEVVAYLREHADETGERLGTMGDDGEKFGAWPDTFEHCWGKGRWVERFFEALEANADWLTTIRPSDWLADHRPIGRVAIPPSSYAEMNEWSGGFWRDFQVRYREINDLHKQMLRTSAKVNRLDPGQPREQARDHLQRGQSNDVYWHGLFGGIYIPHMRAATLGELIAAEDIADRELHVPGRPEVVDLDLDGRPDVRVATAGEVITIDLDEGAGIGSWDIRAARHPLAAVLRRRPEPYHERIRAATAAPEPRQAGAAPVTIHDAIRVKEPDLADRLTYDGYERRSALVRVLPADADPASWRAGGGPDLAELVAGRWSLEQLDPETVRTSAESVLGSTRIRATKTIRLGGGRLDASLELEVSLAHLAGPAFRGRVGIEWPTLLLGGGGNPAAWWEIGGRRSAHDGSGAVAGIDRVGQGNDWLGLAITTRVSPTLDAWWAPIETVSNSEDGFERVYQGSALLLSAVAELPPGGTWSATIRHEVAVARER